MDLLAALCGAFLSVLFLQSGLDKVLDRKGNVAYFVEVTSRGPMRRWARASLNLITLLEVLTGCLSAAGLLLWFGGGRNPMLLGGAVLAAVSLLFLFAGQRINKDYAGAAGLVPYFLVALVAVHVNLR
jgi:hypothetical protein